MTLFQQLGITDKLYL